MTGGLAGAYYEYDTIPVSWINQLINKQLVEEMLGRFAS
jgi:ADP-ribosylglycohydrolase